MLALIIIFGAILLFFLVITIMLTNKFKELSRQEELRKASAASGNNTNANQSPPAVSSAQQQLDDIAELVSLSSRERADRSNLQGALLKISAKLEAAIRDKTSSEAEAAQIEAAINGLLQMSIHEDTKQCLQLELMTQCHSLCQAELKVNALAAQTSAASEDLEQLMQQQLTKSTPTRLAIKQTLERAKQLTTNATDATHA